MKFALFVRTNLFQYDKFIEIILDFIMCKNLTKKYESNIEKKSSHNKVMLCNRAIMLRNILQFLPSYNPQLHCIEGK